MRYKLYRKKGYRHEIRKRGVGINEQSPVYRSPSLKAGLIGSCDSGRDDTGLPQMAVDSISKVLMAVDSSC